MKLTTRQAANIMLVLAALFFGAIYAAGWAASLGKYVHGHRTAPWGAAPTMFSAFVVGVTSAAALIGMFVYFDYITKGKS